MPRAADHYHSVTGDAAAGLWLSCGLCPSQETPLNRLLLGTELHPPAWSQGPNPHSHSIVLSACGCTGVEHLLTSEEQSSRCPWQGGGGRAQP